MPVVSVICLCYNHEPYVAEALQSVVNQTYGNIELIVVDDASTDGSARVIDDFFQRNSLACFIRITRNVGNCKAFNMGLKHAKGDFIIDLAADDVLLPGRVAEGVKVLQEAEADYGVHFSDATYIDDTGKFQYNHSDRFPHESIPQGDIYKELIRRFFICPPTMMFRKEVIHELNGYDETLAYEDFDFWIRSSRNYKYCYSPEILVKKRLLEKSLSARQFERRSKHQETTYKVCEKIFSLNRSAEERKALSQRLIYEIGQSLKVLNSRLAIRLFNLLIRNSIRQYSSLVTRNS